MLAQHRLFSWKEETSMFDPNGVYSPVCECFFVTLKAYIPDSVEIGKEQEYLDSLDTEEIKWAYV